MSIIDYAINKIKTIGIPKDVLELAFLKKPNELGLNVSIDSQIEDLVIKPIVLRDLNVLGGLKVTIPLNDCEIRTYNNTLYETNAIINVPYKVTNGRKILEALEILIIYNQEFTYGGDNRLLQVIDQLNRSKLSMENNLRVITDLRLIGPNTILVYDNVVNLSSGVLVAMVEHNSDLSNISMRYADDFYKLVKKACEAYIYNSVVVELNRGAIYNGHELGKVNEIIESYASAEEEYEQMLEEKWGKIMFMADRESMDDYVKSMIGLV